MEEMLSQMTTQVSYKNAAKMFIPQCNSYSTQKLATYHSSYHLVILVYIRM